MTSTAEPLVPAPATTLRERWHRRIGADPRRRRLWSWLAPALVTLLAAALRLPNLGHPVELVFDETYYVKDAWSQWALGYPSTWPDGADARFAAGESGIYETGGSFVVHPPLGRFIIGAGMALLGADSSTGWRLAVALAGVASVLVLYLLARELTRSTAFATVAAALLAVDGLAIVMSRVALLDGILTLFVLLAFWFVALDRRHHLDRLAALVAARAEPGMWGPVLWRRPWLVAAGAAAGAACAVKWSGLYVLAALGLYVVVSDALARRRAGIGVWPADAAFRQGPVAFVLLVPVAAAVYLASWAGWLGSDGGWDRHAVDGAPATGLWAWVPLPLQNLWAYHLAIYNFHVGLETPHGYASPAWQWPFLLRPTSMYWHQDAARANGCGLADGCTEAISSLANPLTWWAGTAAALYLVVRFVMTREWRLAFALVGIAATYLPWLLYPERTIFQFYTVVLLPFFVLALTFALRDLARGRPEQPASAVVGERVVLVFLIAVVAVSAFWYPVWTGIPVPYEFWRLHNWLPTWV